MTSRVGIELSPTACRIVEVDGALPWRRTRGETRVRSFAVLPPSSPETRARLNALRKRPAAVVVWGGRSELRQVMVTAGSYESMREEALASLSAVGLQTSGMWADIAPAGPVDDRAARRTVVVSMASASDLTEALLPLREAGIRLRTVTTPAVALGSLARMRRAISVPDAIESYIALDEEVTCIALVRNGVLLAARELPWGFIDADRSQGGPRSREDITARLAGAIGEFAAEIGASPRDLGQVCVCGGHPELRSLSVMLLERHRRRGDLLLDVEVEPLDSLFGIDAARLPEPADEFRERGAELRLAWAAAADWPPAINLLRPHRRRASKAVLARAAVLAGAAAGLSGGWWLVERGHLWQAPQPATRTASSATPRGRGPAPPIPPGSRVTPLATVNKAPPVIAAPVAANQPPAMAPAVVTKPPVVVNKAPVVMPPPVAVNKVPVVMPPPVAVNRAPVAAPPSVAESKAPAPPRPATMTTRPPVAMPEIVTRPPATAAAPVAVDRPPVAGSTPTALARVRPAASPEVAQPFDAVLGTILYSPDRKLAIIDGRVVAVGDDVRGARIVEITAASVMLRDAQGRLRQLTLSNGGR
jgi:hypothetical protein